MADTTETTELKVEATPDKLSTTIEKALTEHEPKADETKAEEKKDEVKDDKAAEKPKAHGLSDEEQEKAFQFYAALKDPEQAPVVLEYIAKTAGYAKVETKAEAKEAKADLTEILKKALGPELDYLADKMGPAISAIIDDKLKENTKDIRDTLAKDAETKLAGEAAAAMLGIAQSVFKKDEIPDDVVADMNKLMEKVPPSKDMSVKDYIELIYYNVAGRRNIQPVNKTNEEKVAKNRTDAPSRLASEGNKQPVLGSETPKFKDLTSAIAAAVEQVNQREK